MMTVEQIAAANKANMETLFGLTNKAIESVEKIIELNMAATKAAFNDVTKQRKPPWAPRTCKSCWLFRPA